MAYRKRTLRTMPPKSRRLARLIGELDSIVGRLKHLLPAVEEAEMYERAADAKARAAREMGNGSDVVR